MVWEYPALDVWKDLLSGAIYLLEITAYESIPTLIDVPSLLA